MKILNFVVSGGGVLFTKIIILPFTFGVILETGTNRKRDTLIEAIIGNILQKRESVMIERNFDAKKGNVSRIPGDVMEVCTFVVKE